MNGSFYDVLGVSSTATDAEVSAAYRQLAKTFHPDAHPGATGAERQQFEVAMSRINEAYNVLKDPGRRAEYDRDVALGRLVERIRPPRPGECFLCGHALARHFRFEHQTAYLISARAWVLEQEFCRSCALHLGRAAQNRTLKTGWWGITAFLRNFLVVFRNARALNVANRMTEPHAVDDVVGPMPFPLGPGRSLFARGGVYFAALVVVGVTWAGVAGSEDESYSAGPGWQVGSCVEGYTRTKPVSCDEPNNGRVVAEVGTYLACPSYAESYVEDGGDVFCIDLR